MLIYLILNCYLNIKLKNIKFFINLCLIIFGFSQDRGKLNFIFKSKFLFFYIVNYQLLFLKYFKNKRFYKVTK